MVKKLYPKTTVETRYFAGWGKGQYIGGYPTYALAVEARREYLKKGKPSDKNSLYGWVYKGITTGGPHPTMESLPITKHTTITLIEEMEPNV